MKTVLLACFSLSLLISCSSSDSEPNIPNTPDNSTVYFPPVDSNSWETIAPSELSWNDQELSNLMSFLEDKNTKSFIMLHNGKIAVEWYMNGHSDSSPWYWASAVKTLTSAMAGIAQDNDILNINNKVSDYLGTAWTSAPLEKENLITCKNLLSMDSGLDDSLGDDVSPENLQYVADAGTRWAYHNVYVKMQVVISQASGQTWANYFNVNLRDVIGMSGNWIPLNDLSVYWSNTRSMARFGLLIFANGKWEETQIIPEAFLNEATNTSQNINEAYGYLWWLNGKSSFHLPQSQFEFPGELIPNAPSDMFAALGKMTKKFMWYPVKI